MRVLWFTNTPSNYPCDHKYEGGGWISSLESLVSQVQNIELGVSFLMNDQPIEKKVGRTVYYPIPDPYKGNRWQRYKTLLSNLNEIDQSIITRCKSVIDTFRPDLIHIFGTENVFGLLSLYIDIPIIIHIQGLLNPIFNAYLPPFVSWNSYIFSDFHLKKIKMHFEEKLKWEHACKREHTIIKKTKYFCGRTEWDKMVISTLSPQSHYYHVDETLRAPFYASSNRKIPSRLTIISTLSNHPIKGTDTVLKTAKILKETGIKDFNWLVFGSDKPQFAVKATGIQPEDVDVSFMGIANADTIRKHILSSTLFVHLSYIDNSPNSVCEAQMLGCPVVISNAGGKSSLVTHGEDGFLVPCNSPYQTAYYIKLIYNDPSLNHSMGEKAKVKAWQRHNKEKVLSQLVSVYHSILGQ